MATAAASTGWATPLGSSDLASDPEREVDDVRVVAPGLGAIRLRSGVGRGQAIIELGGAQKRIEHAR